MERLPGSKGCFVCGTGGENRRSLGVHILWDEEGEFTEIAVTPDETWCGYERVVHGGILAALFDDAMAWAIRRKTGEWAVTGEMSVRYLRPVRSEANYTVRGKVDRISGRRLTTSAVMVDASGRKVAEATALFIRLQLREEG